MNIVILSRKSRLYSTRRLVEEAVKRGHRVTVLDTLRCYMDITSTEPQVYYRNRKLVDVDAVIPRIGASVTFYGLAILRQFETLGVYTLNDSSSISISRDKLHSLQKLAQNKIGMPKTSFAHSTKMTSRLIKLVGDAPLVLKLLEGTQGKGVVLAETKKAAESVIDAFRELDANFLVQQFIQESGGSDIRCFVVGDQVVASMIRKAKEGEFRSNLHRGGKAEMIQITDEEKQIAINASKAMGLQVSGVDLLRSQSGPKVIEVNSSPGLEGIERTTQVNIAEKIIAYIETQVKK